MGTLAKIQAAMREFFTTLYQIFYGIFIGNKCLTKGCECKNYCDDLTFNELTRQSHDSLYAVRMIDSGIVGRKLKCDLCSCPREAHQYLTPRNIEPQYMPAGGLVHIEQMKRQKRTKLHARFGTVDKMAAKCASRDEVLGDGPQAALDSQVLCCYEARFASDNELFEENDEFKFKIGANKVIPGLDQEVRGMKVGGARTITIPPHYAYGDEPVNGRKGETLVFKVKLLASVR